MRFFASLKVEVPSRKGAHQCALASRSQSPYSLPWSPSRSARSAPQPALTRPKRPSRSEEEPSRSRGRRTRSRSTRRTSSRTSRSGSSSRSTRPSTPSHPTARRLKPWLATSYKVSKNGKKYTFKLRKGVRFSNGKAMTAADVKFSIDDARAQDQGWGYLDVAIKNIKAPNPSTVVFNLKYRWAPFLADIALFANGIIPKNFAGQKRAEFYKHPIGTGPFMWDKRVVGQSVTFKRNPYYWQKGKPYLDAVKWTYVSDQNTRELQLRGRADPGRRVPALQLDQEAAEHPRREDVPLPLDADRLPAHERVVRAPQGRARPPRDLVLRSTARQSSRRSSSASASRPTPSCRRRCRTTTRIRRGSSTTRRRRRPSWRSRSSRTASPSRCSSAQAARTSRSIAQVLQQALKALKINVKFRQVDTSTEFSQIQERKYQLALSYWTMDIADPDELVTFAVDPKGGNANSLFTGYNNPKVIKLTRQAQRETNPAKRRASTRRSSGSRHRMPSWGSCTTRRSAGPRRTR